MVHIIIIFFLGLLGLLLILLLRLLFTDLFGDLGGLSHLRWLRLAIEALLRRIIVHLAASLLCVHYL